MGSHKDSLKVYDKYITVFNWIPTPIMKILYLNVSPSQRYNIYVPPGSVYMLNNNTNGMLWHGVGFVYLINDWIKSNKKIKETLNKDKWCCSIIARTYNV